MERQFNLIKTGTPEVEKRIFPRFPFSFLMFKTDEAGREKVFEVRDISYTGMQISLKDGQHGFKQMDKIVGTLSWRGRILEIDGTVKWVRGPKIGIAFSSEAKLDEGIKSFLCIENIISSMRPLHESHFSVELPPQLKYWLRADGPVEIFVWMHGSGNISRFQILLMKDFVEWEDGKGVKTGLVVTDRDLDTPLQREDEFVFEMDEGPHPGKIDFAMRVIDHLPESFLPADVIDFLKLKIRG